MDMYCSKIFFGDMTGPYFGIMTYVTFFGFVPRLDSGIMTVLYFSEL